MSRPASAVYRDINTTKYDISIQLPDGTIIPHANDIQIIVNDERVGSWSGSLINFVRGHDKYHLIDTKPINPPPKI